MCFINSFGIIGGDKRQLYCAKSIADDGCSVFLSGFDKAENLMGLHNVDTEILAQRCEALILPLPVTTDGININTPLSDKKIRIDEDFVRLFDNKPIFCGMKNKLKSGYELFRDVQLYDYGERDEFAVENAVPTSEGAIELAMHEYDGTVNGSRCLVTGYGRIGRVLSDMLTGLGAKVSVSARKQKDLAFIRAKGMQALPTYNLSGNYDLIFNTVPSLVFDAHTLAKVATSALVIDLASLPGGVDFDGAERLSIKAIHALSIPGKSAPKAEGIIIKNAVYNIIEEEAL
ncbi:MAG: dipicolinate synthase subunit DpsA [Clostridia bacterium]|nr:dipicolinate synthase subunit DpsA [Clostridia bacterium]